MPYPGLAFDRRVFLTFSQLPSLRTFALRHLLQQLKAYVSTTVPVSRAFNKELYGKLPRGGLTPEHYYKIAPRLDPAQVEASVQAETISQPQQ